MSSGAWTEMAVIGLPEETNDRIDLRSGEVIVLWEFQSCLEYQASPPTTITFNAKEAGVKFVCRPDLAPAPQPKLLTDKHHPRRLVPTAPPSSLWPACCSPRTIRRTIRSSIRISSTAAPSASMPTTCPGGRSEDYRRLRAWHLRWRAETPEWASEICGSPAERPGASGSDAGTAPSVLQSLRRRLWPVPDPARSSARTSWLSVPWPASSASPAAAALPTAAIPG